MISVSKKTEYGLAFLLFLSKNKGKTVSLKTVSRRLDLPYRFLGQVATDLKNEGIVESKEGKAGGYNLAVGWREKSIYDLLKALGENKRLVRCLGAKSNCAREDGCKIKKVWQRVEKSFIAELKKIKLEEI